MVEIFEDDTHAFAALKSDGSVVTWGYWNNGHTAHNSYNLGAGDLSSDVIEIFTTDDAEQH